MHYPLSKKMVRSREITGITVASADPRFAEDYSMGIVGASFDRVRRVDHRDILPSFAYSS